MRQKSKQNRKTLFCVVFLVLMVACSIIFLCMASRERKLRIQQEEGILNRDEIIRANTKSLYVACCDIRAGEIISEERIEKRQEFCSQEEQLFFSDEDIGKEAVVDISVGSFLSKSMANQSGDSKGLRELCYRTIVLADNVQSGDVVDIRIRYPNGEDYVVLAGKKIRMEEEENTQCYLRLSEEELLMMSAALFDTEFYRDTGLYASKYPVPTIQERSVVTYVPMKGLLELIQQSPNVLKTTLKKEMEEGRTELELRLGGGEREEKTTEFRPWNETGY